MKKLFFLLTICITIQTYSQKKSLNWETDFETAKQIASEQNKPILVYFNGSDWCSPCKMLKKDFFESKKFKDRAVNMVLLMVDIPRRIDIISPEQKTKNLEMARIYNTKGSYPTLVALNSLGNIIDELSGYSSLRETDRHFAFVDAIIQDYK